MTDIAVKEITAFLELDGAVTVTIDATWSPPGELNGNLTGYDAHIGLEPYPSDLQCPPDGESDFISMQFKVSETRRHVCHSIYHSQRSTSHPVVLSLYSYLGLCVFHVYCMFWYIL